MPENLKVNIYSSQTDDGPVTLLASGPLQNGVVVLGAIASGRIGQVTIESDAGDFRDVVSWCDVDRVQLQNDIAVAGGAVTIAIDMQAMMASSQAIRVRATRVPASGFPRAWELLGFLFNRKTRDELFTPAYNVLLEDYQTTRSAKFRTRGARAWLAICFTLRTFRLVADCYGTAWRVAIVGLLIKYGPDYLADFLHQLFQDQ